MQDELKHLRVQVQHLRGNSPPNRIPTIVWSTIYWVSHNILPLLRRNFVLVGALDFSLVRVLTYSATDICLLFPSFLLWLINTVIWIYEYHATHVSRAFGHLKKDFRRIFKVEYSRDGSSCLMQMSSLDTDTSIILVKKQVKYRCRLLLESVSPISFHCLQY